MHTAQSQFIQPTLNGTEELLINNFREWNVDGEGLGWAIQGFYLNVDLTTFRQPPNNLSPTIITRPVKNLFLFILFI